MLRKEESIDEFFKRTKAVKRSKKAEDDAKKGLVSTIR